jgi:transcriptional regulator with XRE-family HTH domain
MAREPEAIAELRRALGERLATFRQAAELTQVQLAQALSYDRTTVAHIEKGRSRGDEQFWITADKVCRADGALLASFNEFEAAKAEYEHQVRSAELARYRAKIDEWHGRPTHRHYSPTSASQQSDGIHDDDPVKRREFLTTGGAVVIDAALASSVWIQHPIRFRLSAPPQEHWSKPIYNAVIDPAGAARGITAYVERGDGGALRQRVDRVMGESLSSDYGALERSLPRLIGLAEAVGLQPGGDDPVIQQALSDLYAVVGWTLVKADYPTAAWVAAQRAIQAAERADDVLRIAAAMRCLAEVHMRAENYEDAVRTALLASVRLESLGSRQPTVLSLRGAALLSAAAASARRGDSREALATLNAATLCAAELGKDHSDLATVFGPTNAAIHQVAIPLELGDARAAVHSIPHVKFKSRSKVFAERMTRFLIDAARSYAQVNEHNAAIDALARAEKIAPDELRHHRLTRELVPQLMARENRNSGLRALAARCNLLT